jgi:hypothetical protein
MEIPKLFRNPSHFLSSVIADLSDEVSCFSSDDNTLTVRRMTTRNEANVSSPIFASQSACWPCREWVCLLTRRLDPRSPRHPPPWCPHFSRRAILDKNKTAAANNDCCQLSIPIRLPLAIFPSSQVPINTEDFAPNIVTSLTRIDFAGLSKDFGFLQFTPNKVSG